MTLNEIIKIVNGKSNIDSDELINNIKTNSKEIEKNDIFIALKGNKYNGKEFIEEAINKGAIACIVEDKINDNCIVVEDTYQTLFYLGQYFRKKYNIPLIAITGSTGKTTTKDLITHILSSKYNVLSNVESKNNIIGVSDTLFKLNDKHEIIVMELGSNHIGEISHLSKMCMPTTSIITNIGTSHIGYFKNKRNIFKEKLSIQDGMIDNDLIVNGDDKYLKKIEAHHCGLNLKNDLVAYNIYEDINYFTFNIRLDKEYKVVFNNPGKHFINDILLAIYVCLSYDVPIKTIINKINSFKITKKRMNYIKVENDNILINDCYNSSLESIKVGLDYINKINSNNKVLIVGDILELGKHSKKIHKKINKLIKKVNIKQVYTVGTYSKYINGQNFNNVDDLIEYLKDNPISNRYIYIKGSRRMNLDKVVDFLNKKSII